CVVPCSPGLVDIERWEVRGHGAGRLLYGNRRRRAEGIDDCLRNFEQRPATTRADVVDAGRARAQRVLDAARDIRNLDEICDRRAAVTNLEWRAASCVRGEARDNGARWHAGSVDARDPQAHRREALGEAKVLEVELAEQLARE